MRQRRSRGGVGGALTASSATALFFVLCAGSAIAGTVSYQEGDGKGAISQTDDTRLAQNTPDTNYGSQTTCVIDAAPDQQHCTLKFPNIFGGAVDQIPPGSHILNATLTLFVEDPGIDCPIVYQLTEGWTEAEATWNSRRTATPWTDPGAEGLGSHKLGPEGVLPCSTADAFENVDVTQSVQGWSNGAPNEGWVLLDDNNLDGVDISTSEHSTAAQRPQLTVSFVPTVFYSVGTNVTDLKTGSPTITISGSSATLSNAQTGNIGVGDVIDHDLDNKLVYIAAVITPARFFVQTADGGVPPSVSGVPVNSIKRAFNSITAAVALSSDALHLGTSDLAGTFRKLTWVLYDDDAFREEVVIDGYTTAPDYHVTLTVADDFQVVSRVSQRHQGVGGTGAVLKPQNGSGIETRDDYIIIEWLEVDGSEVSGASRRGIEASVEGNNVLVQNVLIHDFLGPSARGLVAGVTGTLFRNCVVYDNRIGIQFESNVGMTAQNCTIYNSVTDGLRANSSTGNVIQNIISMGSGGADFAEISGGLFAVADNNMSSDATADDFGGPGHLVNQDPRTEFVSLLAPIDLHLRPGAVAIDAGTDLSGTFTDDIDGENRPLMLGWEMGADESPLSSSVRNYRSIGTAAAYGVGAITVTSLSDVVS